MTVSDLQQSEEAVQPGSSESANCRNCGRATQAGRTFVFRPPGADPTVAGTIKCALCGPRHRPMLRRSAIVAVVVGTILTLLNQGDGLFSGNWNNALYWKIPLTYCVPFLVATYGALTAARR